jgi:hypothetical protein
VRSSTEWVAGVCRQNIRTVGGAILESVSLIWYEVSGCD